MNKTISNGILKIKAAYIFIFFSCKLSILNNGHGSIDILPDFVGYIILISGINTLARYKKSIKLLEPLAYTAMFISFTDDFYGMILSRWQSYFTGYLWQVLTGCIFIYLNFGVITELAAIAAEHNISRYGIEGGGHFLLICQTLFIVGGRFMPFKIESNTLTYILLSFTFMAFILVAICYISIVRSMGQIERDFRKQEKQQNNTAHL